MGISTNVGIIGCGNISNAYFNSIKGFEGMKVKACADVNPAAAEAKAKEHSLAAVSVDALLADPEIQIVINLTTPQSHAEINALALNAGKHVHCEKPFAVNRADARRVLELAKAKKLLVGCAPDTFLGGGQQTCRKLVDDGWIGRPVAGTAFMMCGGHETWHPAPGFYYLKGGGPVLDMGPYYITALVNMLGPVKRVCACAGRARSERLATSEGAKGKILPVEVNTHAAGTLEFQSGALVTLVMSFDVLKHTNHNIEIHGTEGSLRVPDPNGFGGEVKLYKRGMKDFETVPLSHGYCDNSRGVGALDMAYAVKNQRPNRCSGALASHVLDVMLALDESSDAGRHILIDSSVERPAALPLGLRDGTLDN